MLKAVSSFGNEYQGDIKTSSLSQESGGPSKRTRQNTMKANLNFSTKNIKYFLEEVSILSTSIASAIKELV